MSDNRAEGEIGRNDDVGRNGTMVPARNDSNRRLLRSEEFGEQLLPGLPNEITLDLIAPKMPWKEIISTMSSVSRTWHGVIRSREVYDARARSHSTEEFVIINRYLSRQGYPSLHSIALYSPREKKSCYLPLIPHLRNGFPPYCQCVSLHGKIYVLGGEDEFHMATKMGFDVGSRKVYVLDLYGRREWKECATMGCPRVNFGCGILDGKIYVFGGYHIDESLRESEMYDPKVDAWYPIKTLPCFRSHHEVAIVGQELFVYGGNVYEGISVDRADGPHLFGGNSMEDAFSLQIYNPAMDDWFEIDWFLRDTGEQIVLARGKLISISQSNIFEYDMEDNSWALLHTCSFPTIGPEDSFGISPVRAVVVDGELLLRVYWYNLNNLYAASSCLLQSRGFGSENDTIVWENAEGSPSFRGLSTPKADFMSLVEL